MSLSLAAVRSTRVSWTGADIGNVYWKKRRKKHPPERTGSKHEKNIHPDNIHSASTLQTTNRVYTISWKRKIFEKKMTTFSQIFQFWLCTWKMMKTLPLKKLVNFTRELYGGWKLFFLFVRVFSQLFHFFFNFQSYTPIFSPNFFTNTFSIFFHLRKSYTLYCLFKILK